MAPAPLRLRAFLVHRLRRSASAGPLDGEHATFERPRLSRLVVPNLLSDHELVAVPLRRGRTLVLAHLYLRFAAVQLVSRGLRSLTALTLDRQRVGGLLDGHRTAHATAAAA